MNGIKLCIDTFFTNKENEFLKSANFQPMKICVEPGNLNMMCRSSSVCLLWRMMHTVVIVYLHGFKKCY